MGHGRDVDGTETGRIHEGGTLGGNRDRMEVDRGWKRDGPEKHTVESTTRPDTRVARCGIHCQKLLIIMV